MRCLFCNKGPMDGVTIHRINEKGVDGVWACERHIKNTDVVVPPDVQEITDVISGRKERAR